MAWFLKVKVDSKASIRKAQGESSVMGLSMVLRDPLPTPFRLWEGTVD